MNDSNDEKAETDWDLLFLPKPIQSYFDLIKLGIKSESIRLFIRRHIHFLGVAHYQAMCNWESSCLVVVDRGFGTADIIAHEIGHQYVSIYHAVMNFHGDPNNACVNCPVDWEQNTILR